MVEFAVCLPFLMLLLGAMTDFGFLLHTKHRLVAAARVAVAGLVASQETPSEAQLQRLRAQVRFAAHPLELEPGDVQIVREDDGYFRVSVQAPLSRVSPVAWLPQGAGDSVRVVLRAPAGGGS